MACLIRRLNDATEEYIKNPPKKEPASSAFLSFEREPRPAARITQEDLLERIIDLHELTGHATRAHWRTIDRNLIFSLEAFRESNIVLDDLSEIIFDTENCSANPADVNFPTEGSLLGLQTLENGISFVGFSAGGDWECPLFVLIYWDGLNFRGYVPMEGNMVNPYFRSAFGSESDSEYGPFGRYSSSMPAIFQGVDESLLSERTFEELNIVIDEDGEMPIDWIAIRRDIERHLIAR